MILHIETATTVCSVALSHNLKCVAKRELNSGYTHSENLTVFIGQVIKEAGKDFSDIEAVAVSKGPGSFTGLRIGVSAAKGLAYMLEIPLIAVNTLQAMAWGAANISSLREGLLCPMIDARRMEVYCAMFDQDINEVMEVGARIINEDSFSAQLERTVVHFFGDGSAKCKALLGNHPNAIFHENINPSADFLIPFADAAFKAKRFEDVAYFEPFYLKDFLSAAPKKKS